MADRETSSHIAPGGASAPDGDPWTWVATAAYRVAKAASYGPCPDADLRQLQCAVRAARGIAEIAPRQRGVALASRPEAVTARPVGKTALGYGPARGSRPIDKAGVGHNRPGLGRPVGRQAELPATAATALAEQPGTGHRLGVSAPEPLGIGPRTSAYYRGDQLPSINGRQLTVREFQILSCAAQGKSNENIGRELFVSEHTIKTHLRRLFDKIGAANRAHAVAIAFRQGALS